MAQGAVVVDDGGHSLLLELFGVGDRPAKPFDQLVGRVSVAEVDREHALV